MHRLLALAVIVVASPADAHPRWAVGLEMTAGNGGAFETWDLGWRLEPGLFFRSGHWQVSGSTALMMNIEPEMPERDSAHPFGVTLGGRVAYHVPFDTNGSLYIAAGFERIWINGDAEVRRECRQTRTCYAGFYPEVPDYDAWAPQLRVGVGPYTNQRDFLFGTTFEVIVEPIALRGVPPNGIRDIALYAAVTMTVGAGPKR
jgi:hypothetical protein